MKRFDLCNPAAQTAPAALLGLLRRAVDRRYAVVWTLALDYVTTRFERTRKGSMEVEFYKDGSGLEVAFLGHLLILGVEAKRGRAGLVSG